uniref:F-box associated domain-containing protein n=1 Tax=Leersia perrieri TaxID=77586 RepID=A0A0D9WJZ1_9ORYZ
MWAFIAACHGLTLLFQPISSEYYVCDLSTGDHIALPPCAPAAKPDGRSAVHARSSTGLGFGDGEHKVVRLYESLEDGQPRCEMYSLVSGAGGGWRPLPAAAAAESTKYLDTRPPVFLDGSFYWLMDASRLGARESSTTLRSRERSILSLAVATQHFTWIGMPESLAREACHLDELDGALCAVVDYRLVTEEYELWTWTTTSPSWSLRCRISLPTLTPQMRRELGLGFRLLPLCTSPVDGKILLATSRHKVYAYDAGTNSVEMVFSMHHFVDVPPEPMLTLNVGLHGGGGGGEESSVVVGRSGEEGRRRLEIRMGNGGGVVERREGRPDGHILNINLTPQAVQMFMDFAQSFLENELFNFYKNKNY